MSGLPHGLPPDRIAYDRLQRAALAWEWLRRDPDYQRVVVGSARRMEEGLVIEPAPAWCVMRWGCLCIADPDSSPADTPVLWSATVQPSVLRVEARSAQGSEDVAFDLRRWANHAALVVDATGCEHLLLRGGDRSIRLDIVAGSIRTGPIILRYIFDRHDHDDPAIATLRRFLCFCRARDFEGLTPDGRPASRRSIDALRVYDALTAGASIRDIGVLLFGGARVQAEWHAPGEALKSYCRRLVAHARSMASGGYKVLLR